jgi:hypothetical protein
MAPCLYKKGETKSNVLSLEGEGEKAKKMWKLAM